MLYYGMILLAVVMFGFNFYLNGRYQKFGGSSLWNTVVFTLATGFVGVITLLIINGFSLHATPFTLLMAVANAVDTFLFVFCSIRALEKTNLSLFSVFSMIGGMALPFVVGILFYEEGMTFAKAICFVWILLAMCMTVEKGEKKSGGIYCVGIFICNGMSGVLSMIYNNASFEKGSSEDYSIWSSLFRVAIALVIVLILFNLKKKKKEPLYDRYPDQTLGQVLKRKDFPYVELTLCGILGNVANLLLLLALVHVPGSMQYPLVTGGVMIITTLFGYLTDNKPRRRDWISVGFAVVGMLSLLLPV